MCQQMTAKANKKQQKKQQQKKTVAGLAENAVSNLSNLSFFPFSNF